MATNYVYEILVRGGPDGFKGAHVIHGRIVTDEDGDSREKIGKAEPIEIDQLSVVMGETSARMAKQVESLLGEKEALENYLQDSRNETHKQIVSNEKLKAENSLLQEKIQTLLSKIGELQVKACCEHTITIDPYRQVVATDELGNVKVSTLDDHT